jgi:hypothetical protein
MLAFGCLLSANPFPIQNTFLLTPTWIFFSFDNSGLLLVFSVVVVPHTSVTTTVCAKLTFDADDNIEWKLSSKDDVFALQLFSRYSKASKKLSSVDCSEVGSLITIVSVLHTCECIGALDNTCDEEYPDLLQMVLSKRRVGRSNYNQVSSSL